MGDSDEPKKNKKQIYTQAAGGDDSDSDGQSPSLAFGGPDASHKRATATEGIGVSV